MHQDFNIYFLIYLQKDTAARKSLVTKRIDQLMNSGDRGNNGNGADVDMMLPTPRSLPCACTVYYSDLPARKESLSRGENLHVGSSAQSKGVEILDWLDALHLVNSRIASSYRQNSANGSEAAPQIYSQNQLSNLYYCLL